MDRKFLKDKNILIMGLGNFGGGADAAIFAIKNNAKVTITDLANHDSLSEQLEKLKSYPNINFTLNEHLDSDFINADIVIVNPAVPPESRFIQIAKDYDAIITSQIELFFQNCPAKTIGITGSNGKSTTTALTHHILQNSLTNKVWLTGNIGNCPMLEILDDIKADDIVVIELSSFQLDQLVNSKISPDIALLTNLTPNHLDRHITFDNYSNAKENIFKFNTPISIFNADDKIATELFNKYSNINNCIKFSAKDVPTEIKTAFKLPGNVNLQNLSAAITIAKQFNITDEQITTAIKTFTPLPHRLEFVAEIQGVKWYNDSIATTQESTIAAIDAFDNPKILIAGGYDKNLDFTDLGKKISSDIKAVILIGQTAQKIADLTDCKIIEFADSLQAAVTAADELSTPGDCILLSPACASYDMFKNFQQRGNSFKSLVNNL